jgi:hypothetical protein
MVLHFYGPATLTVSAEMPMEPVIAGEPALFRASAIPSAEQWFWDFNGDGVEDASGEVVPWTFPESGTFHVSVRGIAGFAEDAWVAEEGLVVQDSATAGGGWRIR